MAQFLDKQKFRCEVAAIQSVQAITRCVPIVHAGPGCADKMVNAVGSSGYISQQVFPCSSISEQEVVFGGAKQLRSTIQGAEQLLDADLFVVLTGCTPEIIGDNTADIVAEFADAETPVIFANTAGFRGSNYLGHEIVVNALIDQVMQPADQRIPGLVNIWADVPYQDEFWQGNLFALEDMLRGIGLTPNAIFGYGHGLDDVKKVPAAELNVLVSPWVGLSCVKHLEERFGTPYLHIPELPIGPTSSVKFLFAVGEAMGVDSGVITSYIETQEALYYHFIERFADAFLESSVLGREFTCVADAQYALAVSSFLINDWGLAPTTQYISDDTPKKYRAQVADAFAHIAEGVDVPVDFSIDGYAVHEAIRAHDYVGQPLVFGSTWEKPLARDMNANFVSLSWPSNGRLIMNRAYAGYAGALTLIEDIYSAVKSRVD